MQMYWITVNASHNVQPQGLLISGRPHALCVVVMFVKITMKIHQRVRVFVLRCVQEIVMDIILIRLVSIRTWWIYLQLVQILTMRIELLNCASSNVLQEPTPTKLLNTVKSDAQGLTLPILLQESVWLDVQLTTLRMCSVPPTIHAYSSAPHHITLKTQP